MDNNDSLARVSIFGHEYTVKAPADSTYIKNIAEYVDTKMREVQEGMPNEQSTERIAILAAMNISDELFTHNKNNENFSSEMENKIQSLIEIIDENI
ncbi:MAG TPA: cell division protein ZapA [Candidatus Marinimicrobia bacterium]|jgi:cell division protein ZapA|nr:cell division protein ZapA [Candidatus Neomarinimicrobiota bacterium]MDP5957239.1 cell division protein ZapA [Candidatus Neomarinimicrobiota bacterium]MDP6229194.1 cell division protein ZapA [Candidatus Neomarinimicrobiota bacterium]MDP7094927.1 cell division protein ZapA [Candidatus Neomarinimicrobiota bacterium]MDP7513077.1 cell division protein ZapA [Candidatus Neomarinimicrobiota bacterium]|tara:strand:- start:1126 stop:1416 length:291 start_codon:yes stop_codon:yes gene_type:complete